MRHDPIAIDGSSKGVDAGSVDAVARCRRDRPRGARCPRLSARLLGHRGRQPLDRDPDASQGHLVRRRVRSQDRSARSLRSLERHRHRSRLLPPRSRPRAKVANEPPRSGRAASYSNVDNARRAQGRYHYPAPTGILEGGFDEGRTWVSHSHPRLLGEGRRIVSAGSGGDDRRVEARRSAGECGLADDGSSRSGLSPVLRDHWRYEDVLLSIEKAARPPQAYGAVLLSIAHPPLGAAACPNAMNRKNGFPHGATT